MTQNEATQVKDTTIIRAQTQSSDAMMREQNATNGNGHAFPLQYDAASTRWVLYNYYSGISKAMRSFSALYFRFSLGHFDFDLLKKKKKPWLRCTADAQEEVVATPYLHRIATRRC